MMIPWRAVWGLLGGLWMAMGVRDTGSWQSLFNGRDLGGWDTYLTEPEASVDAPGLARGPDNRYVEAYGLNRDPLGVFSVVQADGKPALRISGEVFGMLVSRETFGNYHLKLEYKWGEKQWPPRLDKPRDSGLLYHGHGPYRSPAASRWMASHEFQIQEGDCGDYWCVGETAVASIPARPEGDLLQYDPQAPVREIRFVPKGVRRVVKGADHEKPHGEWNTLELVAVGGESVHVVNGSVVMRVGDSRQVGPDGEQPLARGRLILQSEGAEVFYRNLELRPVRGWEDVSREFRDAP